MKTQARIIRNMVVLSMSLLFGNAVYAQVTNENGIHVSGGSSSAQKASSNIGHSTMATGYNSFASGYASVASGHTSTAIGREAKATGNYSMALGNFVTASAENSFVFGTGFSSVFPLANSTKGIMMGVNSQYPTLTISAAVNGNYTGKVGIGNVTDPQAKLHIKGDATENADILLVSTGTNKSAIRFRTADINITVGSDDVMRINVPKNYMLINSTRVCFNSTTTFLSNINDEMFSIKAPVTIAQEAGTIQLEASRNIHMTSTDGIDMQSESILLTGKVGINTENATTDYALAVDGGLITTKVFIQDVEDWPDFVFDETYKLMPLHELKKFVGDNKHLPDMPSENEVVGHGYDLNEMQQVLLKKIEELTLYTLQQQEEIETLRKIVGEMKTKQP